jgi:hypothetical protein
MHAHHAEKSLMKPDPVNNVSLFELFPSLAQQQSKVASGSHWLDFECKTKLALVTSMILPFFTVKSLYTKVVFIFPVHFAYIFLYVVQKTLGPAITATENCSASANATNIFAK